MKQMKKYKSTIKYAFIASLPVCAGYVVLAIGFGLIMYDKGYSWLWSLAMSVFIYAGSLQYVGVGMLTAGASFVTCALTSLMVNIRHLFYGVSMLEEYKKCKLEKPYVIFALTDETYSLVCSADLPADVSKRAYFFFVSLFNQTYWVVGSVIGGLLGQVIPFDTTGIDFAMTALFIVVAVEQWEKASQHISAITGFASAIVCLMIFGPDRFLIPTMILITILLFAFKKTILKKEGKGNE